MAIVIFPHLIPAVTIPNGLVERALTEPLALDRDEVVYVVCSHPRVRFGKQEPDGSHPVLIAEGDGMGTMGWSAARPWARVSLPPHATPSRIPWAIIDPALEWAEGLEPIEADLREDPDGGRAQNRAELLPWIYDRHLELSAPPPVPRGSVDGGLMEFRIEYVGSSGHDALRAQPARITRSRRSWAGSCSTSRTGWSTCWRARFASRCSTTPKKATRSLR
jgi:hypothetical protein